MEELMNKIRSQKQDFLEKRAIVMEELGDDFKNQYEEVTRQIEEKKKLLENKNLNDYERMNLRADILALEEERREMKNQINARVRKKEVVTENSEIISDEDLNVKKENVRTEEVKKLEGVHDEVKQLIEQTKQKIEQLGKEKNISVEVFEKRKAEDQASDKGKFDELIGVYEQLEEEMEKQIRDYEEIDEEVEQLMKTYMEFEAEKEEEADSVETSKSKVKAKQSRTMNEIEKMYHEVERKIKEAEEKLKTRDDLAVRVMLKRGIATLEEQKKALEMKMKETGVESVSVIEDRKKQEEIEQLIRYYEQLEEEMNEGMIGYEKIDEEMKQLMETYVELGAEKEKEEEADSVETSKSKVKAKQSRTMNEIEKMYHEVERKMKEAEEKLKIGVYEQLEEEMGKQIRGYEEIDEEVEQLMETYVEFEAEKEEEADFVETSKAKSKVKAKQSRTMSKIEKMYHEVERKMKEVEEKLKTRDDLEVRVMLKRGIATLEEQKKALEMKMKETGVEFVSVIEDREKQEEIEQLIRYYEQLEEEMNEGMIGYEKIDEEMKQLMETYVELGAEKEKEEEADSVEISKSKVKAKQNRTMSEIEKMYRKIEQKIKEAEEELETRNELEVIEILKRNIEDFKEQKKVLVIYEIVQSQRRYDLIKSRIESGEKSLVEQRTAMEKLEKQEEREKYAKLIKREIEWIAQAETELSEIEGNIEEKLRILMEEGYSKEVKQIIEEYISSNSMEMSRSKRADFSVKPIVGRLEGESVKNRIKRAIKGYVKVNDDMAKLGRKELAQSARYNLKQFGYHVKGNLVYAAQLLGETQDAKNFKALWQDFKESETAKKIRGVVKEVSQKEVVQDMMQDTKAVVYEMTQGVNKVMEEMKEDMREFGKDFKKTTKGAIVGIPGKVKKTAQTGWGNFAYTMQEVDKKTEPLKEKIKENETVKAMGKVLKDISQNKAIQKTKSGMKKVGKMLQNMKHGIKRTKNIEGFVKNMKNKVFRNLREYCPITINREAKSVQAVECATKTVMQAGKQYVLNMRSAAEDSARKLILGLGDKIEGKTNEKEAIMQKKQKDLEREERCK